MALTKAELADLLFENVGLNKREAKDMVESFYEEVRTSLQNNEGVKLSGFGNFQYDCLHGIIQKERMGANGWL